MRRSMLSKVPDVPWRRVSRLPANGAPDVPQHHLSHSNMSACRRWPLLALHLIASFIPWTKVSPPLITCPSVGYSARYSEKTGANGKWDTLYNECSKIGK